MQLSDRINNIVLVPIYVRYSTFIGLLGYITVFLELHSIINDKIPLPSPETSEETLLSVFMLLLLVKIINIVGSSANRAIGHFVFGFYFVFCFLPMCCGLADVTACNAQFADVSL